MHSSKSSILEDNLDKLWFDLDFPPFSQPLIFIDHFAAQTNTKEAVCSEANTNSNFGNHWTSRSIY